MSTRTQKVDDLQPTPDKAQLPPENQGRLPVTDWQVVSLELRYKSCRTGWKLRVHFLLFLLTFPFIYGKLDGGNFEDWTQTLSSVDRY